MSKCSMDHYPHPYSIHAWAGFTLGRVSLTSYYYYTTTLKNNKHDFININILFCFILLNIHLQSILYWHIIITYQETRRSPDFYFAAISSFITHQEICKKIPWYAIYNIQFINISCFIETLDKRVKQRYFETSYYIKGLYTRTCTLIFSRFTSTRNTQVISDKLQH